MPDVNASLMIDFESSGLLATGLPDTPRVPTGLEVAWTVINTAGDQLTPLRHRFTVLPLACNGDEFDCWQAVAPAPSGQQFDGPPDWYSEVSGWDPLVGYPVDAVRAMHRDNGLMDDMTAFMRAAHADERTDAVLQHWETLDALLLDDIVRAGASAGEPGTLTLSGGGVSHYEDRFLRYCAPTTMGLPAMHYSGGLDVSTVLRVLTTRYARERDHGGLIPYTGKADDVLRLAQNETHPNALPEDWDVIELEPADTGYASADRDTRSWLHADQDPHRAVSGVARALAAYRLLPYVLDQVTAGYADTLDAPAQA